MSTRLVEMSDPSRVEDVETAAYQLSVLRICDVILQQEKICINTAHNQ